MTYPALKAAALWCVLNGVDIPPDVLDGLASVGLISVKALQDYDNSLTRLVSIYLNELRTHPGLPGASFGVDFANVVEAGLNEAWRLGIRENDAEMTDDMQAVVDGVIAEERTHIPDLAAFLVEVAGNAATMGEAITLAQVRLSLWVSRYTDVYNQAVLASADEKTKLIWTLGATEQHCSSCGQLDGVVAYAREWEAAQLRPQNPPHELLECGGWKCDCSLSPTNERHTRDAASILDRVRQAGISR
jgi:hypothetical protein